MWPSVMRPQSLRMGARRFLSSSGNKDKFFLLRYNYVPGILEKREPFRPSHLAHAQSSVQAGLLKAGGAHRGVEDEEPAGGMFLFESKDSTVAQDFAKKDPYVINGLVTKWDVQEWLVAVGSKDFTG